MSVSRFCALAFGISWTLGLVVAAALQAVLPDSMDRASLLVAKFGPSLAGLIMAHAVAGRPGARFLVRSALRFAAPLWAYVVALLGPAALWIAGLALFERTGGSVDWSTLADIRVPGTLLSLATFTFLGGGLGEELGWRGFMLPMLQRSMSAGRATLILGLVWAAWHYPALLLDRSGEASPVWLFTVFVVAASVLMTSLYNATGGNVLLMILFHASANATEDLLQGAVPLADEARLEMRVVALYVLVAGLVWVLFRGRSLSRGEATAWPDAPAGDGNAGRNRPASG